jgi:hypothetical protein
MLKRLMPSKLEIILLVGMVVGMTLAAVIG